MRSSSVLFFITACDLTICNFRKQNESLLHSLSAFSRTPSGISLDTKPASAAAQELNQRDYPRVYTWQKARYLEMAKPDGITKTTDDGRKYTPTAFLFAEDQDGNAPTDEEVASMRSYASDIFFDLARERLVPHDGWSTAGSRAKNQFRSSMETRFPNLRLCSGGWKADWIATHTYSNWKSSHGKKFSLDIKPEPVLSDDEVEALHVKPQKKFLKPSTGHAKRKVIQSDEQPNKRRNLGDQSDSSNHLREPSPEPIEKRNGKDKSKAKDKIVSAPPLIELQLTSRNAETCEPPVSINYFNICHIADVQIPLSNIQPWENSSTKVKCIETGSDG